MRSAPFLLAVGLVAVTLSRVAAGAAPVTALDFRLVNQLDQVEPWDSAQVFHAGVLWSGRSVVKGQNAFSVEVYAPGQDGMVASVTLPHSVQSIFPYAPNAVLVLGATPDPYWVYYYSVVRFDGQKTLTAETHYFPIEYSPNGYVGDVNGTRHYFLDMGNGGMYVADSSDVTQVTEIFPGQVPQTPDQDFPAYPGPPWRTPLAPTEAGDPPPNSGIDPPFLSPNFLAPRLHGPGRAVMLGDYVFAVEHLDVQTADTDLVRVDVAAETTSYPTWEVRNGIANIAALPSTNLVVAAERGTDKLLFVDPSSNRLAAEQQLAGPAGDVWDVAAFGHCVAVLSTLTRAVEFLDTRHLPATPVSTWDLSQYIDKFHRARALAVDGASGHVFVRSDEVCPASNCAASFNDTREFSETSGATLAACTN